MKTERLSAGIRIILLACGLLLIPVLFKPIWRIELDAPQYPEGLMMNISAKGLGGDVDIINGLNHYIGMKTLHNEDFIEFKILPYIITAFIGLFIFVALMGNRRLMRALLALLIIFGVLAMVDFWKWEYDYGHNLDPTAAIIVPGQAYQPPLIGFKQLLNFGAYSIPDIGGWLFVAVGLLLLLCVIIDYYSLKKAKKSRTKKAALAIIGIGMISTLSGCNAEPQALIIAIIVK
jgi:copper chaperone NosL